MTTPILYLPMEVSSRELDSRLLLAASALRRGFDVVLGQKWLIERNIEAMPPGVYFSKTMTKRDGRALARARDAGYLVAAVDEEMPGVLATKSDMRWISADAVGCCELIFIAGTQNTRAFSQRFGAAERVVTVGNPRWDLLKPSLRRLYEAEVRDIRNRFGRFILVNTNLGLTNTEKGTPEQIIQDLIRLGKLDPNNPGDMAYYADIRQMEDANRAVTLELLRRIPQTFPDGNVVLRPHPSERLSPWEEAVAGLDRVHVVRSGPAVPWIIASQALVHTNCTTGVEAHALDKPAICVMPTELSVNDRYLSNRVNPVARSADQTIEILREMIAGEGKFTYEPGMQAVLADALSGGGSELASEAIIDRVWQAVQDRRNIMSANGWRPGRRYRWNVSEKNVRAVLMPNLAAKAVSARLAEIGDLVGGTAGASVEQCGAKLVWITGQKVPSSFQRWQMFARLRASLTPRNLRVA